MPGLVRLRSLSVSIAEEIGLGGLVLLGGSSEFKLTSVSEFAELSGSLLCLVEVVVAGLDAGVLVGVLLGLHGVEVLESVDLLLVALTLFLELGELGNGGVNFSAERVAGVGLLSDISLGCKDLCLSS